MKMCTICGEEHEYVSLHLLGVHKVNFVKFKKENPEFVFDEKCKECGEPLKYPAAENSNDVYCSSLCKAIAEPTADAKEEYECKICKQKIIGLNKRNATTLLIHHFKTKHKITPKNKGDKNFFDTYIKTDESEGICKKCRTIM